MSIAIQAETRTGLGKGYARRLRVKGFVPGVLYGLKRDPLSLQVEQKQMEDSFRRPESMHQVVELTLNDAGKSVKKAVLLKDYQADMITRRFTHVDFQEIDPASKVSVKVPVHFVGRAEGVKEGGNMQLLLRQIPLVCSPTHIPPYIDYDVTPLKVGDVVHLRDLTLPEGVELALHAGEFALVSITGKVEEEAAPAAAQAAPTAPIATKQSTPAPAAAAPAAKAAPKKK